MPRSGQKRLKKGVRGTSSHAWLSATPHFALRSSPGGWMGGWQVAVWTSRPGPAQALRKLALTGLPTCQHPTRCHHATEQGVRSWPVASCQQMVQPSCRQGMGVGFGGGGSTQASSWLGIVQVPKVGRRDGGCLLWLLCGMRPSQPTPSMPCHSPTPQHAPPVLRLQATLPTMQASCPLRTLPALLL